MKWKYELFSASESTLTLTAESETERKTLDAMEELACTLWPALRCETVLHAGDSPVAPSFNAESEIEALKCEMAKLQLVVADLTRRMNAPKPKCFQFESVHRLFERIAWLAKRVSDLEDRHKHSYFH